MELKSANRYINICKNQNLPSKHLSQICLDHVKDLTRYDMIEVAKKAFCTVSCPDKYQTCDKFCVKLFKFWSTLESISR